MPDPVAPLAALARAHGEPLGRALIRVRPEDFFVDEELPFTPDGAGEHLLLQVEKRGHNSSWLAQRLSQFAGVHPRCVSFSGRKDRHAVTRQWFSIQLPGRADPDFSAFAEEGVRVLAMHRHGRKLRTGTHRINRFVLVLREVDGDRAALAERLALIERAGVPNYFGDQRFGHQGVAGLPPPVQQALATGRLPAAPGKRGMVISVLRSALFNRVLDARVRDATWDRVLPGELVMLDGANGRWFAEDGDPTLAARCAAQDVHPGGPLAGTGEGPAGALGEQEARLLADGYDGALPALARWRVEAGRRALRSRVMELQHDWPEAGVLRLSFALWRGSYATMVLRELCDARDASQPAAAGEADHDDHED